MIVVENECVDCGSPCIGASCKYLNVKRYYCDQCKFENRLYEFDGQQLCLECIVERLDIVEGSDIYV